MGSSVAGNADADNINVAGAGNVGMTFRGSNSGTGNIFFADNTSGDDLKRGQIVYNHADNSMRLHTNATEKLRIDSSGKVLIGTTTASNYADRLLTVGNTSHTSPTIELRSATNGQPGLAFSDSTAGDANSYRGTIEYNHTSNYMMFRTDAVERLRIDSSGRLLIGTTAGAAGRVVHASNSGGNSAYFHSTNGSTGTGSQDGIVMGMGDATNAYFWNYESGNMVFATSATERMRITSGGNIQITDPNNSTGVKSKISFVSESPHQDEVAYIGFNRTATSGAPCDIVFNTGTASGTYERMRIDSSGSVVINDNSAIGVGKLSFAFYGQTENGLVIQSTWNGNNASYVVIKNHSGTTIGSITASTTATSFNTSSDYRLKENVVDITNGITRVKQLSPKRFNFIDDADTTVDGFLAHEAQTVVPEAVTGTHNEVDDDGNAVMQCIDQTKLVPLLTAALQEAIAEIESLKARVATLEG